MGAKSTNTCNLFFLILISYIYNKNLERNLAFFIRKKIKKETLPTKAIAQWNGK